MLRRLVKGVEHFILGLFDMLEKLCVRSERCLERFRCIHVLNVFVVDEIRLSENYQISVV